MLTTTLGTSMTLVASSITSTTTSANPSGVVATIVWIDSSKSMDIDRGRASAKLNLNSILSSSHCHVMLILS